MGEGIAAVEIDLMQPIDPDKTPKVHIPTLNHIGLWVDNLDNAVIELTSLLAMVIVVAVPDCALFFKIMQYL